MYLKQSDLFEGTTDDFKHNVMKEAETASFRAGDCLFGEGHPAKYLYILTSGRVKLSITDTKQIVYIVSHQGECFGWSSLLDRESYSASAECMEQTELVLIDREKFQRVIDKDPANGLVFFKSLAWMIGKRLLYSYLNFAWF